MQCYLEVYDIDRSKPNWYKTACQASSRLLSNVRVCERIAELLETGGFNDENITKQHLFLINQHKDFGVKMKALSDYYKLKGKYAPDKIDLSTLGKSINYDEGQANKIAERIIERGKASIGASGAKLPD